jgi:hypothetical protein
MRETKPDAPRELTREEIEEAQKRLVKRKKIHSTVICQEMADMLPRALAGCSALLALRERIEKELEHQETLANKWLRAGVSNGEHECRWAAVVLRSLLAETPTPTADRLTPEERETVRLARAWKSNADLIAILDRLAPHPKTAPTEEK